MGNRKGQVSIETLIIVGAILGIVIALFFAIHQRNIRNQQTRDLLEAQAEADKTASIINNAVIVGDGYRRNTTVKQSIGGATITEYLVNRGNTSGVVAIHWTGIEDAAYRVTAPLLSTDVNAANITGTNRITVKNVNGTVQIEER